MKVFIVCSGGVYEETDLEGTFATQELAEAYIARVRANDKLGYSREADRMWIVEEPVHESLP